MHIYSDNNSFFNTLHISCELRIFQKFKLFAVGINFGNTVIKRISVILNKQFDKKENYIFSYTFASKRIFYYFYYYSCRKFFGITDCAYLYTDSILKENISQDKSKDRFKYLLGRLEENANKNFSDYKSNEEILLDLDLAYMSKTTKLILNAIQYDVVRKKRTENFKYLNKYLSKTNKLNINNITGAYMYPYFTEEAEQIRKELIKNKIYIPILWPNVLEEDKNTLEYKYANNILLLPCDQRYNKNDMQRIIKILNKLINKGGMNG